MRGFIMSRPLNFLWILPFLALFALNGCAETELFAHVAKNLDSGQQGMFKVGNPYKVEGKTYRPQETYSFTETGIASWYGPDFHGKRTANGEIYDMNELTAAHRTLQLPSIVRVTNLENGRSLIVRVNDRGPFKRSRVMDLSKRAAELLGFKNKGTAKVRIDLLKEESMAVAQIAKRGESTKGFEVAMNEHNGRITTTNAWQAPPSYPAPNSTIPAQPESGMASATPAQPPMQVASVESQPLAPPPSGVSAGNASVSSMPGHVSNGVFYPDPMVQQMAVTPSTIYVQVGSFGVKDNAYALAGRLKGYGYINVAQANVGGKVFYRVRIPADSVERADTILASLTQEGNKNAVIVVD